MNAERIAAFYERRTEQHLELASRSEDPTVKALHLDFAARYATRRELAMRNLASPSGGPTAENQSETAGSPLRAAASDGRVGRAATGTTFMKPFRT